MRNIRKKCEKFCRRLTKLAQNHGNPIVICSKNPSSTPKKYPVILSRTIVLAPARQHSAIHPDISRANLSHPSSSTLPFPISIITIQCCQTMQHKVAADHPTHPHALCTDLQLTEATVPSKSSAPISTWIHPLQQNSPPTSLDRPPLPSRPFETRQSRAMPGPARRCLGRIRTFAVSHQPTLSSSITAPPPERRASPRRLAPRPARPASGGGPWSRPRRATRSRCPRPRRSTRRDAPARPPHLHPRGRADVSPRPTARRSSPSTAACRARLRKTLPVQYGPGRACQP